MEVINQRHKDNEGWTPKIIELPSVIVLNSHLYTKTDLNPLRFDSIDIYNLSMNSWNSIFYRYIYTNYYNTSYYYSQAVLCGNRSHHGFVRDSEYPDRFFLFYQYGTNCGAFKYIEHSTNFDERQRYINYLSGDVSNGAGCNGVQFVGSWDIFYQNNDYAIIYSRYAWATGWASAAFTNKFYIFDKNTKSYRHSHDAGSIGDASYNYFYMEDLYPYHYFFVNWHLNHYVIKYNVALDSLETVYDNPESGADITCNPIKIGSYYYYLVDSYKRTNKYSYQLCKLKIDGTLDKAHECQYEYIDIQDNYKMDLDGNSNMSNINHPLIHECFYLKTNNNDYMIIVARSQPNGEWYSIQHKLVVLKIESNKAIVKQVESFSGIPCRGVLSYYEEDGKANILITLHTGCCKIWRFEPSQEKYVNTFTRNGTFYVMGLDEQQRLWLQNKDTGVEMFDKVETATARVYFENEIVQSNETSTKLYFWTKNIFDEYTDDTVIINLHNGIVFEDDSIEKEFISSKNGPTEVRIKIVATYNVKAKATITIKARAIS